MKDNEQIIYGLLVDVFSNKAYSSIKLNEVLAEVDNTINRAYITKVFYGVIEKSVQFDYMIAMLSDKKPKNSIVILLKIGLYLLRFTETPSYAAINKTVNLAKSLGKNGVSGFVNAVLRKSAELDLIKHSYKDSKERLSVLYSYPLWAVNLLTSQYGDSETEQFLSYKKRESTHIRHNPSVIDKTRFENNLQAVAKATGGKVESSKLGYYVSHNIMKGLKSGTFTAQSLASMIATNSYVNLGEIKQLGINDALDVCAAPGGKSVYLKHLFPELNITACDIHQHKTKLIDDYSNRMGVRLNIMINDATKIRDEWKDRFSLVMCDVPCSGLGLVNSKPDIILNRSASDIIELSKLQLDILTTSASYVKSGGILCYSTCTIIKTENQDVVQKFLQNNSDFEMIGINNGVYNSSGFLQLLPQIHDTDGFFIARMKRK